MPCNNCGGINMSPWRKQMKPVKPWDLLKKDNWTDKEVRLKRLEICHACTDYLPTGQCKHCMCFMSAKTALMDAFCPLRKW